MIELLHQDLRMRHSLFCSLLVMLTNLLAAQSTPKELCGVHLRPQGVAIQRYVEADDKHEVVCVIKPGLTNSEGAFLA
jgi:hypothetical protein